MECFFHPSGMQGGFPATSENLCSPKQTKWINVDNSETFSVNSFFFSVHECWSSHSYCMRDPALHFCFLSTPVCSENQLLVPFSLNVNALLFCGIKGICGNTWCSELESVSVYTSVLLHTIFYLQHLSIRYSDTLVVF